MSSDQPGSSVKKADGRNEREHAQLAKTVGMAVRCSHHRNAGSRRYREYLYGHTIQGAVGVMIASALLFYMTRPSIRGCFVAMPKQIVRSQDP